MEVFSTVRGKLVLEDILDQGFFYTTTDSETELRLAIKEGRRQLAILIRDLALSPMPEPEEDNSNKENSR